MQDTDFLCASVLTSEVDPLKYVQIASAGMRETSLSDWGKMTVEPEIELPLSSLAATTTNVML